MARNNQKGNDSRSPWGEAGLALSLPSLMAAGPFAGFLIAYGINRWLDLQPPWSKRITIFFILVGMLAGARETIRLIKKIAARSDD